MPPKSNNLTFVKLLYTANADMEASTSSPATQPRRESANGSASGGTAESALMRSQNAMDHVPVAQMPNVTTHLFGVGSAAGRLGGRRAVAAAAAAAAAATSRQRCRFHLLSDKSVIHRFLLAVAGPRQMSTPQTRNCRQTGGLHNGQSTSSIPWLMLVRMTRMI